jgi:hypothetical protein
LDYNHNLIFRTVIGIQIFYQQDPELDSWRSEQGAERGRARHRHCPRYNAKAIARQGGGTTQDACWWCSWNCLAIFVVRLCCCAFAMTGPTIVANHNLDQVDHVEATFPAQILHMFFMVIAP